MTQARLEIDDYTARVLDVIKGKYGLKNRSDALNKFTLEKGIEYVEPPLNEMVLRELDETYNSHMKKHNKRKMSKNELKKLLDLKD
ncbi:DUF2683 family protein [archaeon]|jgi:hypothetical protein|nr:DUF2683 family protein [Candidatus Woesearchaeota archaeon]MBT3463364.1 DUF2683 family protein [archaeon]MBT4352035.1 DUF2683 family protein [archaeon]MBT4648019.1 DUF2683 family protein [archaeon]MBT7392366.1 DUF2683 family protein [archaeon]